MQTNRSAGLCLGIFLMAAASAPAGTFFADFNSGHPSGTKIYGDAFVDSREGVNNSGVLKLTAARHNQTGSLVLDPLDGKTAIASFEAKFKMLIGNGTGADGISFCCHTSLPDGPFPGGAFDASLVIMFDTFKNSPEETTPGINVYLNQKLIAAKLVPNLRQHKFADVSISLDESGKLNLSYDQQVIFDNVPAGRILGTRQFGFAARTGGQFDEHFIDDLTITTRPASNPFVENHEPIGNNVSPSPKIVLTLRDHLPRIKTSSIRLRLDGKEVSPVVETGNAKVLVSYEPGRLLMPGTEHTVELAFADDGPFSKTQIFSYSFTISTQVHVHVSR